METLIPVGMIVLIANILFLMFAFIGWVVDEDEVPGFVPGIFGVLFLFLLLVMPVRECYDTPIQWKYTKMEYAGANTVYVFATDSLYNVHTAQFQTYRAFTMIDTLTHPILRVRKSAFGVVASTLLLERE